MSTYTLITPMLSIFSFIRFFFICINVVYLCSFFFSSRRRHTRSVSAFLLNRSSDLKGKDTRDYLAAAFPELNAWERAGADASSAGMVDAGFENQKELTKMQLDNQKEIAEMQNETQKEIAGIQSATSRQNTKDQ